MRRGRFGKAGLQASVRAPYLLYELALQAAEKNRLQTALYQGTTSVVPIRLLFFVHEPALAGGTPPTVIVRQKTHCEGTDR